MLQSQCQLNNENLVQTCFYSGDVLFVFVFFLYFIIFIKTMKFFTNFVRSIF